MMLDDLSVPPLELVSAGGFISTVYFETRESTEDLDFFMLNKLSEQHINDFYECVMRVADYLSWNRDWMNAALGVTIPNDVEGREKWIADARAQDVVLYEKGKLKIYAAPWKWCIASKLKRLGSFNPILEGWGHPNPEAIGLKKIGKDISDLIVLFKHVSEVRVQKEERSVLIRDEIKGWYTDGPPIKERVLDQVARAYEEEHGQTPFEPQ
jgi:hypothetical protein